MRIQVTRYHVSHLPIRLVSPIACVLSRLYLLRCTRLRNAPLALRHLSPRRTVAVQLCVCVSVKEGPHSAG